jgi:hypothetical protein
MAKTTKSNRKSTTTSSKSNRKPKTQPKSKKAAAAQAAAAKTTTVAPKLYHDTNRYAEYGHAKDAGATRTTEKRYAILDAVKNGGETLGSIQSEYGYVGLKNIARHIRHGRIVVRGITKDANPKNDSKLDKTLADTLATMSKNISVTFHADYKRLCSTR